MCELARLEVKNIYMKKIEIERSIESSMRHH